MFENKKTAEIFDVLADGQAYTQQDLAARTGVCNPNVHSFFYGFQELRKKKKVKVAGKKDGKSMYRLVDACFPLGRPSPPIVRDESPAELEPPLKKARIDQSVNEENIEGESADGNMGGRVVEEKDTKAKSGVDSNEVSVDIVKNDTENDGMDSVGLKESFNESNTCIQDGKEDPTDNKDLNALDPDQPEAYGDTGVSVEGLALDSKESESLTTKTEENASVRDSQGSDGGDEKGFKAENHAADVDDSDNMSGEKVETKMEDDADESDAGLHDMFRKGVAFVTAMGWTGKLSESEGRDL